MVNLTGLGKGGFNHVTAWQMAPAAVDPGGEKGEGETATLRKDLAGGIVPGRPGRIREEESASAFLPG
ncbi:MAG: hypothetical protein A2107_10375 [Verrucomicrobia bacterium GWF2_62_7]|nr:MAG: hypothetical protein A2107_10375 [Verrucomicrobia bacterium GWF2_62_7]